MDALGKLMLHIGLVDQVTKPLQGISGQLNKVNQIAKGGFARLGAGAAAMAAGSLAIKGALGPAIEMDGALRRLDATGMHAQDLKRLANTALQFSVTYGTVATDFINDAQGIQRAIHGLSDNELPAVTRASAVLARATQTDTGTITRYLGDVHRLFARSVQQMGHVNFAQHIAGKTAAAVRIYKTSADEIATAMAAIGPGAVNRFSEDDTLSAVALLSKHTGGAEAGSQWDGFASGLGKASAMLGMHFTDASGQAKPLLDILAQLKARYGETFSPAAEAQLQRAFGAKNAVQMLKTLSRHTRTLATGINALGKTKGMDEAQKMAAKLTSQWARVGAAWRAIRTAAYASMLPAINRVVGAFADGGETVLRWTRLFPHLTKVMASASLALAGLGIITGAWIMLVGLAKLVALAWSLALVPLQATLWLVRLATASNTLGLAMYVLALGIAKVASVAFAVALGVLKGAFDVIRGTLLMFQGVMAGVNAVMWANPAFLIAAAVIALVVAVAAAIYYWDEIKATLADWGVFEAVGRLIDALGEKWQSLMAFFSDLKPLELLSDAFDKVKGLLGLSISAEAASLPAASLPDPARVTAPLATYRQGGESRVPPGGLAPGLIQSSAKATAAHQPPARSLSTGDIHMHVQQPLTPDELAKNTWLEQRG